MQDAPGISFHASPPDTHQHNGVAEAIFDAVIPKVRALMNPSQADKFPRVLWPLAVQHVVYVHNRTATTRLDGISAYEFITGEAPEFNHLRPWGCVAFVHDHHSKDALSPTATRGTYAGHDETCNSATVYIPSTKSVRRTVHVTFDVNARGCLPVGVPTMLKVPTTETMFVLATDEEGRQVNTNIDTHATAALSPVAVMPPLVSTMVTPAVEVPLVATITPENPAATTETTIGEVRQVALRQV